MFKFTLFMLLLLVSPQTDFEPLTAANAHRIELISTLGYGSVTRLGWSDNQTLDVGTTVDTYRYDLTQVTPEPVVYHENRADDVADRFMSPDDRIRYEFHYENTGAEMENGWLQFYDAATGEERGDAILFGWDCGKYMSPTWQVIVQYCGHVSIVIVYDTYGHEIIELDADRVDDFTFTPDGSRFFVAYDGKVKALWCEQACNPSYEIPYESLDLRLTVSPDNRHLLLFSPYERYFPYSLLEVWDYREQRQILRYAPDVLMLNAFYTPNEDQLVALTVSRNYQFSLVVWDTTDFHQTVYPFPPVNVPEDPYRSKDIYGDLSTLSPTMEFSPDGSKLALSFYQQAFLWDLSTGEVWKPDLPVDDKLAFAPDNQRIAVETTIDTVAILDTTTKRIEHTFINYLNIEGIVSPDSRLIARFKNDRLEMWDWQQMKQLPLEFDTTGLRPLLFSDAHQLVVGGSREALFIDLDTYTITERIPMRIYQEGIAAITPEGSLLSARILDSSVYLSYSDRKSANLEFEGYPTALQFAPDGKTLAVSENISNSQITVSVIDPFTFEKFLSFDYAEFSCEDYDVYFDYPTTISALAFSPDGRYLAVGGLLNCQSLLEIRDLQTNRVMTLEVNNLNNVENVAFSHDGTLLAAGISYSTIQLWDVRSGEEINTETYLLGQHLQFTDKFLFSSGTATMRVWGVP